MSDDASQASETVIPFPNNGDPLDRAGHAACDLVHQAASVADQKAQHLLGVAHKLTLQLRAAEDQVADLQAEMRHYRDRADRAEKWLHRIAMEIQHNFFAPDRNNSAPAEPANLQNYAPKRQRGA